MTGRLYEVTIEISGYVWAESQAEARYEASSIVNDAHLRAYGNARPVRRFDAMADGWEPDCLVYGTEQDTTLADAWPDGLPTPGEFHAHFLRGSE